MDYTIRLTKKGERRLEIPKLETQIGYVLTRILTGTRVRNWDVNYNINPPTVYDEPPYIYEAFLKCIPKTLSDARDKEFAAMHKIASRAGAFHRWECPSYEGSDQGKTELSVMDVEIPDDWKGKFFSHIYQRDAHIEILMSALRAAMVSNFENRYHAVLWGPPACGKTEIARTFKDMLGDDAAAEFDATATTEAGALRDLAERPILPRVLVIEEIEKADEKSLRWLLGILDQRAEIRKTTAREQIQRDVRLLCIATVNDYDLFCKQLYGALASRFPHHLYCERPSVRILFKILYREIDKIQGNRKWARPAIALAHSLGIVDPRRVAAVCMCGREDLLTGEYQAKILATTKTSKVQQTIQSLDEPEAEVDVQGLMEVVG